MNILGLAIIMDEEFRKRYPDMFDKHGNIDWDMINSEFDGIMSEQDGAL